VRVGHTSLEALWRKTHIARPGYREVGYSPILISGFAWGREISCVLTKGIKK
jgi:hypothetical protein